jgi:hypothetical protein
MTNLQRIQAGELGNDAFIRKIPRTQLAILVSTEPNHNVSRETFTATLIDLASDWGVVLYKAISAEVLGERIERIMAR